MTNEEYQIVIPGRPPAKNSRHRPTERRGRRANSDRWKSFRDLLTLVWRQDCVNAGRRCDPIDYGVWEVQIWAYSPDAPRETGLSRQDVDSPVSAVLDAMNECVFDDDHRIKKLVAIKEIDQEEPQTIVTLRRLPEEKTK